MRPPAGAAPRPRWRGAAEAVLALVVLNAMLAFSTWWPTPGIVPDARIAPEFVLLWTLLIVRAALAGPPGPRALAALTALYLLLVFGRYLDVTVPSLFGRQINLYWDGAQLPRFLWVSAQDHPWWASAGAVLAAGLLLLLIWRLLRWGIGIAGTIAAPYALQRRWAWLASALALAIAAANYAGVQATWGFVSKPVLPTYWRQAVLLATALSEDGLQRALPPSTTLEAALAAPAGRALQVLGGRDVYLIFLESVGGVTYDNAAAAKALAPARERFAADLAAGGQQVVSAFVRSPTFGGASDLAHLSLLSGLDLADPMRHDLLLTTQRPTLNTLFRAHGYETYGLYPALSWDWPERAFYDYQYFEEARLLDYRGPRLGHWWLPDQWTLARFEQKHPRGAGSPPRFVFFGTITCHFPFSPVPPYQPDWQKLLGSEPFDPDEVRRAMAERIDWLDMMPGYLRMVDYTYRWLGGFMRQPAPRETVYILLGDHQPTGNISGEGASWDVPVHIVSQDPVLLARFRSLGFADGLFPPRPPLGGMHDLTAMLLAAFGEPRPTRFAGSGAGAGVAR